MRKGYIICYDGEPVAFSTSSAKAVDHIVEKAGEETCRELKVDRKWMRKFLLAKNGVSLSAFVPSWQKKTLVHSDRMNLLGWDIKVFDCL